jgi:hypothetical protein
MKHKVKHIHFVGIGAKPRECAALIHWGACRAADA